jgi:enediyne polyketide synthase
MGAALLAVPGEDKPAGIGPWHRCFVEHLQPPRWQVLPGHDGPWRVRAATDHPFQKVIDELFPDEPDAGRTLAIISNPGDPDVCAAALRAAADAISTGQLIVISHGPAFSGFWASLHAEHPSLGITLLRVPESAAGLRAARQYAATTPSQFRELSIDAAGRPREPVMVAAEVTGGDAFPLGPSDVVLVSRGTNGAGLALAQVLACCGAPVAVVGRAGPDEDSEVVRGLGRLRSAGARIAVEAIDIADPADMAAALQRIERKLGPVTAIGHAARADRPRLISELTETELCAHAAAESAGLRNLVSSIRTERLRLIATFGSVIRRYGMAGRSLLALSSGSLAEQAQRMSDAIPGCRALHVDWPGWAGTGLGEQADLAARLARARIMPISIDEGSRMLLKMLTTPDLPAHIAVHGRIGVPAPSAVADAGSQPPPCAAPGDRFLEVIRVHYPGVELVCEATLSLRTDPYLADYKIDGIPVLPAAMALEAMAQAASALAGRPVRHAISVSMSAPVVLPAASPASQLVIRICALRDGDSVRTAVRCADSGFAVDHFVATFRDQGDGPGHSDLFGDLDEPGLAECPAMHVGSAEIADGTEFYGPICFQSGRFRRVAFLPEVSPRSCRALVRGGDEQPWFGEAAAGDPAGAPLILGSPGLNDATMHVLQACVPHRRLLPASCDAVTFSGRETDGAVEIRAVTVSSAAGPAGTGTDTTAGALAVAQAETSAGNPASPSPQPVPQPRSASQQAAPAQPRTLPAEYCWDVDAVDAAGNLLVSWRGLRLLDAGPLSRNCAWPPSLLAVYLERSAAELGLGEMFRVSVDYRQPDSAAGPSSAEAAVPRPASSPDETGQAGPPAPGHATSAGSGLVSSAPGRGCLEGFALSVDAGDAAVCSWHAADPAQAGPPADPRLAGLRAELARRFGEPRASLNARLRAIAACLPAQGSRASHIVIDCVTSDDWILLRTGGAVIACTVADIANVPLPVAIAIAASRSSSDPGQPAAGQQQAKPGQRPANPGQQPTEPYQRCGAPAGTGAKTS